MLQISQLVGFGVGGDASIVIAYSNALGTNNSGNHGYSFRKAITLSAGGAQVRVTFMAASSGGNFKTDHCSIALKGTATLPSTELTPSELLFSGVSGFDITPGNTIVSDWLTLTTTAAIVVVVMDFNSTPGSGDTSYGSGSNSTYYKAATASYNTASVSGYTTYGAAPEFGVSKIEVR